MDFRLLILAALVAIAAPGCSKKKKKSLALNNKGIALGNAFVPPTLQEARSLEGYRAADEDKHYSKTLENHKHNPKIGYKNKEKRAHLVRIQEQEARFFDLPIPISATPIGDYKQDSNNAVALYYMCQQLPAQEVVSFYITEMEREGWLLEAVFSQEETLLTFAKPQRFCTVIIRPYIQKHEESVAISLYAGPLLS